MENEEEKLFKEYQKNKTRQMKRISLKLYYELEERNKKIWNVLTAKQEDLILARENE